MDVEAVLNEASDQPLSQFVTANTKVNWLRVILDVVQGQLIKRRSGCVLESESAEDRCTWFTSSSARSVMDETAAKTEVMIPV